GPGEDFFTYLRDAFDVLYEEGAERPRMMSIGLHMRIVGHPGRASALMRFIEYIQSKERVWICRREDIARHSLAPPPARGAGRALNPAKAHPSPFINLASLS